MKCPCLNELPEPGKSRPPVTGPYAAEAGKWPAEPLRERDGRLPSLRAARRVSELRRRGALRDRMAVWHGRAPQVSQRMAASTSAPGQGRRSSPSSCYGRSALSSGNIICGKAVTLGAKIGSSRGSLDHLVGDGEQRRRHVQANRLRHDQVNDEVHLVGRSTGRSAGFAPAKSCRPNRRRAAEVD